MIKMATGEGSPLRQGAGTGLGWFSVATEACGGGTPHLGYVLGVSVYIRGFGIGNKSGGLRGGHEVGGAPRGGMALPPPSWWPRDSSGPSPILRGLLLVQK